MFSCKIWGLSFLEQIEKLQLTSIKKLLNLPMCTPNYAVRLEAGVAHMAYIVFKSALSWLKKVSLMNASRLPRLCAGGLLIPAKSTQARIIFDQKKNVFNSDNTCAYCQMAKEDLFHILNSYIVCEHLLVDFCSHKENEPLSTEDWLLIFSSNECAIIKRCVNVIAKILSKRLSDQLCEWGMAYDGKPFYLHPKILILYFIIVIFMA